MDECGGVFGQHEGGDQPHADGEYFLEACGWQPVAQRAAAEHAGETAGEKGCGQRPWPHGAVGESGRDSGQRDEENDQQGSGDGAVQALIAAYERVNSDFPVRDKRPCITHCNFMSLESIQKMQALGIVADIQPIWLHLDGRTLLKQFGEERTNYFQPYKTIFEHGVVVGGGSDHMQRIGSLRSVNPYNPFLGIWTTLTRQPRWADAPLHPEQLITREQALRFYTLNNAFLTFEEKEKGSLEVGKLADFIVLDRDILTCPVDEVKDISVLQTWLGGKQVYARPQP